MKKVTFNTTDNLILTGVFDFPEKNIDKNKIIILAHGITVDKNEGGVFVSLSNFLTKNGYTTFRFDFRGSGESEGNSVDMTIKGEVDDLNSAINYIKSEGYTEVALLAASFGGSIASFYAAEKQSNLKALCLWNPVLNYDHTFVTPTVPWIIDKVGHMVTEIKKQGWTTLGSRKFVIGKNLWNEFLELEPYKKLKQILIPTIIIHAREDSYVPYSDSEEYISLLKNGKLITIENGEHGFHGKENGEETAQRETLKFFKKYI
jgi:alpha/beta superfamily hydrolase